MLARQRNWQIISIKSAGRFPKTDCPLWLGREGAYTVPARLNVSLPDVEREVAQRLMEAA
jgi:hypothetical protein